uniref:Uncharacterized protein n=1 Tax=Anguilla anguilla TaxID=7936 RepID=A0A0E9QX41_ANGAN
MFLMMNVPAVNGMGFSL